jgi:hypothetical protein
MKQNTPELKVLKSDNFDLSEALEAAGGPVVELAGPTTDGFLPLENRELPEKPIMTNITPDAAQGGGDWSPIRLAKQHIDAQVDVRHVPFRQESVGVFLMSALTIVDESRHTDTVYFREALAEYQDYDPTKKIDRKNQRIQAMEEMVQALRPDGLVILQYAVGQDLMVARALGLEVCEAARATDESADKWKTTPEGPVYEYAVLKKPAGGAQLNPRSLAKHF